MRQKADSTVEIRSACGANSGVGQERCNGRSYSMLSPRVSKEATFSLSNKRRIIAKRTTVHSNTGYINFAVPSFGARTTIRNVRIIVMVMITINDVAPLLWVVSDQIYPHY